MSSHVAPRRGWKGVDLHRLGNALLTVTAAIGTICIVATLAAVVLDVRPLVFRSGSMSPAIDTGALAVARTVDVADLEIGDVVSVLDAEGVRITHRIETVTVRGETATLVLKGDANASVDAEPYVVTTADRVLFDIPRAGYVVSWVSGPVGVFLGGLLVGGVLLSTVRTSRRGGAGGARRAAVVLVVLAIGGSASARVGPQGTLAAFTDQATVTAGSFATHKVVSQATPTCTDVDIFLVGNVARLTWSQVDSRYEYRWEMRQASNGTVVSSGQVGAGQAAGTTVTLDISTALIGTNGNYNIAVRARLAGATTWTAPTETITAVRRASLAIIGLSMRCGHA